MPHIRDVQTACGNIGSDQKGQVAIAKLVQRFGPIGLGKVAMDRGGIKSMFLEGFGDDIDFALPVAEHDTVLDLTSADDCTEDRTLEIILVGGGFCDVLRNGFSCLCRACDFNSNRVVLELLGQICNDWRHGC